MCMSLCLFKRSYLQFSDLLIYKLEKKPAKIILYTINSAYMDHLRWRVSAHFDKLIKEKRNKKICNSFNHVSLIAIKFKSNRL